MKINLSKNKVSGDLLDKVKRKYGNTLENVLKTYESLSEELNKIEWCGNSHTQGILKLLVGTFIYALHQR